MVLPHFHRPYQDQRSHSKSLPRLRASPRQAVQHQSKAEDQPSSKEPPGSPPRGQFQAQLLQPTMAVANDPAGPVLADQFLAFRISRLRMHKRSMQTITKPRFSELRYSIIQALCLNWSFASIGPNPSTLPRSVLCLDRS